MKNLAIYVHIPFCVQKCIYCNFNSFFTDETNIQKYFEKLNEEIVFYAKNYSSYTISSIFIGGGTPSFVDSKFLKNLYFCIKENFKIKENIEFSIECNPNSITDQKVKDYLEIGINRFSIGLQAKQDNLLKMLNRPHTTQDFENAIKIFQNNNIKNFNIDILLGIPNQSFDDIKETLDFVLNFNPSSISAYGLIVEKNTRLKYLLDHKKLAAVSDDNCVEYYDYVVKVLKKNKFYRYEVSNFSKKGKESKHNITYWQNGDYLGFGLSAHSKINDTRFCNTDNFSKYINSSKLAYKEKHTLTKEEKYFERIMLCLRTSTGLNIEKLNKEFNINFLKEKQQEIEFLICNKLLFLQGKFLKVTNKGFKVLNYIIEKLT